MQTLEVISVNLWQILISLLNLLILFLLFKKFLFKPVNDMLAKRQSEIDARYDAADEAKRLYGIEFVPMKEIKDCDAVILAVAHESFKELTMDDINSLYSGKNTKVLTDLKGILDRKSYQDAGYIYWRL